MRPFAETTRSFADAIAGADWYEQVLALHVASGLLVDFFVSIAPGLPEDDQDAMLRALRSETTHPHLVHLLQRAIVARGIFGVRSARTSPFASWKVSANWV